jgi:hypothetical protein
MFVNAARRSEQLGCQFPVRGLFMNYLHVTHITEGLQIVKYRAPFSIDKRSEKNDAAMYTHAFHTNTRPDTSAFLPVSIQKKQAYDVFFP